MSVADRRSSSKLAGWGITQTIFHRTNDVISSTFQILREGGRKGPTTLTVSISNLEMV